MPTVPNWSPFAPAPHCGCDTTCKFTYHVIDPCGVPPNEPVVGATVEVRNGSGDLLQTGTSDSNGDYVVTGLPSAGYTFTTITGTDSWVSDLILAECGKTYQLKSRCAPKIRFKVNTAAAPVITSLPKLFPTETTDGSDIIWTLCDPRTRLPDFYPKTVTFTATSYSSPGVVNPLYPSLCVTLTLQCYSDIEIDLTQSYWGDCYFGVQSCDGGCSYGAGPNRRGLVSKKMEVKFTSNDGRFADDEGQWITLTGSVSGGGIYTWSSGPRGHQNNYMSMDWKCGYAGSCWLNTPAAPEAKRIYYSGTEITLTGSSITYRRVSGTDQTNQFGCTNTTPPCSTGAGSGVRGCYWSDQTGLLCSDYTNTASVSPFGCCPTNVTVGVILTDYFTGKWGYSIRETC
ncbi:carboxypeptidase-like regulatory domain-containing protein [Paludisphaera borealis]|uniref:SD-repeat containing protein B domain-containing protein n=1 Tax=Paludisphaera borealis TaxID=1387353 RepID=A0A1U7CX74_9BACT|nr:carboxypeptidase-like regulatory domain-containing protein [Paludisphaera borealis]APW63547.1 hypothetical protein BSF38_05119 [Paludisphaera borealis]